MGSGVMLKSPHHMVAPCCTVLTFLWSLRKKRSCCVLGVYTVTMVYTASLMEQTRIMYLPSWSVVQVWS